MIRLSIWQTVVCCYNRIVWCELELVMDEKRYKGNDWRVQNNIDVCVCVWGMSAYASTLSSFIAQCMNSFFIFNDDDRDVPFFLLARKMNRLLHFVKCISHNVILEHLSARKQSMRTLVIQSINNNINFS